MNDQSFGSGGWLTASIRNGGSISVSGGQARVQTPNFYDSALVRLTSSLPANYKLRVRLGLIDYDTGNYEAADLNDPNFKYFGGGWLENDIHWLALTDRLVVPSSDEVWWQKYRKTVINSDDHTGLSRPVYLGYMNPSLDRNTGDWSSGQPDLLRTWDGSVWHTSTGNWEEAFTYSASAYYSAEMERLNGMVTFRVYDGNDVLITQSTPVNADLIYGMGVQASQFEWAYVGDAFIDSAEGEAYIDSITLWEWQ